MRKRLVTLLTGQDGAPADARRARPVHQILRHGIQLQRFLPYLVDWSCMNAVHRMIPELGRGVR